MKMWITRSTLGNLKIHYEITPWKMSYGGETIWMSNHFNEIRGVDPFPEVTFENSPMEVELKLIEI